MVDASHAALITSTFSPYLKGNEKIAMPGDVSLVRSAVGSTSQVAELDNWTPLDRPRRESQLSATTWCKLRAWGLSNGSEGKKNKPDCNA